METKSPFTPLIKEAEKGCGERFENKSAKRFPCNQFSLCPSCKKNIKTLHSAEKILDKEVKDITYKTDLILKSERKQFNETLEKIKIKLWHATDSEVKSQASRSRLNQKINSVISEFQAHRNAERWRGNELD